MIFKLFTEVGKKLKVQGQSPKREALNILEYP